jgi:hypothetical protein
MTKHFSGFSDTHIDQKVRQRITHNDLNYADTPTEVRFGTNYTSTFGGIILRIPKPGVGMGISG